MWVILKSGKKNLPFLRDDFKKKLGKDCVIYSPKLLIDRFKNNKLINYEFSLLGDYVFCYHKSFENPAVINNLKFSRGLKYFLKGFITSQNEIKNFIANCKKFENKNGYLKKNIFDIFENKKYKFMSGPLTNQIFKIINLQKFKINILVGNLKTTINKNEFLFYPA